MSGPISTSGPIQADDGSTSVTPDAMTASLRASRTCAFMQRELGAAVDAAQLVGIVDGERLDAPAVGQEDPGQVGEVVLALVVRRADAAQRIEEPVQREGVDPAVELGQRPFGGRRVALLDDPGEPPVLADDAAEAGRVGQVRREDGGRRAGRLMVRQQPADRLGREHRHVAVEQDDRPGLAGQRRLGLEQGVAGPELRLLDHGPDAREGGERRRGPCRPCGRPRRSTSRARSRLAVRRIRTIIGSPPTAWSTFGSSDFIRVPLPAARITKWSGVDMVVKQNSS